MEKVYTLPAFNIQAQEVNPACGDVHYCLTELFLKYGASDYIRSGNGSEFTSKAVRQWPKQFGAQTIYIEQGSSWENGYNDSFNCKLSVVNGEIF